MFEAGYYYAFIVALTTDSMFAPNTTATINGQPYEQYGNVYYVFNEDYAEFGIVFYVPLDTETVLDSVEFDGIVAPVAGEAAAYELSVSEPDAFSSYNLYWTEFNEKPASMDEIDRAEWYSSEYGLTFAENKYYVAVVVLKLADGNVFPNFDSDFVATVNGEASLYIDILGDYLYLYRMFDTFSVSIGDIDANGDINATDYALLKRAVLGTYTLTDEAVGDIDANGDLNASDYALLKRTVLGTYTIG